MKSIYPRFVRFVLIIAIFLGILGNFSRLAVAADHEDVALRVGEQKVLSFTSGERYSPSGTAVKVTRVHLAGRESLLVKAEKPGRATVLVWRKGMETKTYSFQVLQNREPLPTNADRTTAFLNSLEDARVQKAAGKGTTLLLKGEITTLSEGRRIREFASAEGNDVQNQTYPSLPLFKGCLKSLRQTLTERKLDALKLEFSESERWILVTGIAPSESRVVSLNSQLGDLCPWAQFEIDVDSGKLDLIRLKVVLLENYQTEDTLFGVATQWRNGTQLQVNSGRWLSQFGILSSLRALETRGKLKILSQPEIVLRTPGEAELFSGGEIPIETTTKFQSQVFWKNFGLALKVKSLTATRRNVRLDLSAEVSQIDRTLSSDHHPGLQSNRLKTQVDATFNEPLLLSGLFKSVLSSTKTGVPFLSRLPFFNLFTAENNEAMSRTELLAILIPYREVPKLSREKVYGLAKKF